MSELIASRAYGQNKQEHQTGFDGQIPV